MSMLEELIMEDGGKVTLPSTLLARYGLAKNTPIRIVETMRGILLVPLTDEAMSPELVAELEEWQEISAQSLASFPFTDDE